MNDSTESSAEVRERALAQTMLALATTASRGLPAKKAHALWRNLIERSPLEASYASRYVSELLFAENWNEIDAFRAQAVRYASADLDLRFIDTAVARGDADLVRNLTEQFLHAHGNTPLLRTRLYDQYLLQADYAAAEAVARELVELLPKEKLRANYLADRANYLGRLNTSWAAKGAQASDFDIFVINLDSDTVRMDRVTKQLRGAPFTRIPGVRGAYLPNLVLGGVTRDQGNLQKGTVGCFLSHVVVWERVVARGRTALVLEDDAWLPAGVPPSLAALNLPKKFDLVFANERMSPHRSTFPVGGLASVRAGTSVTSKPEGWSAPGTDGYVISPSGARRLLALARQDGIAGDVDWRLLSYSLTARQRAAVRARGGFASNAMAFHEKYHLSDRRIQTFAMSPAIVRQFSGGSVRIWDDALPHSHLAAARKIRAQRKEMFA